MLYLLFLRLLKANGCLFPGLSFHSQLFLSFIFYIAGNFQSADTSRHGAAVPALAAWSIMAAAICPVRHNLAPGPLFLSCFCTGASGGNGKLRAVVGTSSCARVGGGNGSFCPSLGSDTAPAQGMMGSNQEKQLGQGR